MIPLAVGHPQNWLGAGDALIWEKLVAFVIALVIALVDLTWPRWGIGLLFGTLLSVPSALITKAHLPILVTGAVGGFLVGLVYPVVVR